MAHGPGLRQLLIPSIIRSPIVSHSLRTLIPTLHTRALRTTSSRQQDGISITFGSHIDTLLQLGGKKSRRTSTSGSKSRRKSSKKDNIENVSQKVTAIGLDSHIVSSHAETPARLNKSARGARLNTRTAVTSPDPTVTITEVTESAHEESSEPETLAVRSRKPRTTSQLQPSNLRARHTPRRRDNDHGGIVRDKQAENQPKEQPTNLTQRKVGLRQGSEPWQVQKQALTKKFAGEGWSPRKRLSPDALEGIRGLHQQDPERYTTEMLSQHFKVSAEAIRRILKSKWRPPPEKMEERRQRWAKRHDRIWDHQAELGLRPPRRKDREPEGPETFEDEVKAKQILGQL